MLCCEIGFDARLGTLYVASVGLELREGQLTYQVGGEGRGSSGWMAYLGLATLQLGRSTTAGVIQKSMCSL